MRRIPLTVMLGLVTTLLLAGCIVGGSGEYADADARIGTSVDGAHEDRLCVPEPDDRGDDVTIKVYLDLDGQGEIRMTGWDGPAKVEKVDGKTDLRETWHEGWNTGEICIDVRLDAQGEYAIGAYLH